EASSHEAAEDPLALDPVDEEDHARLLSEVGPAVDARPDEAAVRRLERVVLGVTVAEEDGPRGHVRHGELMFARPNKKNPGREAGGKRRTQFESSLGGDVAHEDDLLGVDVVHDA